jgi:thiamine-phosphate pyrophosphorylase
LYDEELMTLADDARRLNLRARRTRPGAARRGGLPALILLTDEHRLADPSAAVARLPKGSAVIVRHYGLPDVERAALVRKLRIVSRAHGVALLVAVTGAADIALARAVGAEGLHLPEWRVRRGLCRALRGRKPDWLMTAAAHSLPALRRAAAHGADAVLLSPVFATASHADARPLGALRLAAWVRASRVPVYALGGLTDRSAARLRGTAVWGIATIGGLTNCRHKRPGE